jgi:pyruvate formate lyase activating enzyme
MLIAGLQKFSLIDYPKKVSAIVFTQGCNFRCPYCHNKKLIESDKISLLRPEDVFDFLKKRQGQLDGVVVTGGEPTLHNDLIDFLRKIKEMGFLVKLDTNGSLPEKLEQILASGAVDYVAMDVKANFDKYNILSGVSVDIEKIKRSMEMIISSGIEYQFRTTWDKDLLSEEDIEIIKQMVPDKNKIVIQNCNK